MIACVEVGALPADIEQLDNPRLRNLPVAVTGSGQDPVIIAVSAEAGRLGLEPGCRWADARLIHPECTGIRARPARYAEVSATMMAALAAISPELEVFSETEAFLDLTSCQSYYRYRPDATGRLIRQKVREASGLSCSVGISGDKTTARWAAKQAGPEGLTIIAPDAAEAALADVPLAALGMGPGIVAFLAGHGVHACGDMKRLPVSVLADRFGNLGRRLWLMAQARDPAPLESGQPEPPMPGIGRTLSPGLRDPGLLQACCHDLADRMGARLRRDGRMAHDIHISLRAPDGWRQAWLACDHPTDDSQALSRLCRRFLRQHWFGEAVSQIRLHAATSARHGIHPDFFPVTLDHRAGASKKAPAGG